MIIAMDSDAKENHSKYNFFETDLPPSTSLIVFAQASGQNEWDRRYSNPLYPKWTKKWL